MPDPLRDAIAATTKSARAFARLIGSDERTVRRWLAGDRAMPGPVLALCRLLTADPTATSHLDPRATRRRARREPSA